MRGRSLLVRALVAVAVAGATMAPASAAPDGRAIYCPPAGQLLHAGMLWQWHNLAPGIALRETVAHDGRGRVPIHVLTVDLAQPGVSVAPLHRSLTSRYPLSALANRPNLEAAVNGMYFSYAYGGPFMPLIENGRAKVMSSRPQMVAGIAGHRGESGLAWLAGKVWAGVDGIRLSAVNEPFVRSGLALYTGSWGGHSVPMSPSSRSLPVRGGHVLHRVRRWHYVPRGGSLLVANGDTALRFLRHLHRGEPISISRRVDTDAPRRFYQGYGTGAHVVAQQWQVRSRLGCRVGAVLVARTAIGWTPDGRHLVLVVVGNSRDPRDHGLDYDQMSRLLASFGVGEAFTLDGGGSSEMVARVGSRHRLSVRNRPQDGNERAIPVGVGVFYRR